MASNYVHFRVPLPGIAIIFILPLVAFGANFAAGEKSFNQRDYAKALKQFKPLAEKNDARAQRCMGVMYRSGYGVARNLEVAIQWFKRAASNGDGDQFAQAALGSIYLDRKRYEESAAYYHQAAKQGHSDAQLQLGYSYALGQGVDKSNSEAVKWFAASCEHGSKTVAFLAGMELAKGSIVPKVAKAAAVCLESASAKGELEATAALGMLHLKGDGVPKDFRRSLLLLQTAAKGNNSEAFYGLGRTYENGSGVRQDYGEAAKWFTRAANAGRADAQLDLGKLYEKGLGVPTDFNQAVASYQQAARQGNSEAQYTLGRCYAEGKITAKDSVRSYMMFNLAAASGYPDARERRDDTAATMTAEQIASAQRLSRDWPGESRQTSSTPAPRKEPFGQKLYGAGSGFFVNDSGMILTNHHVIAGCKTVTAGVRGEWTTASVVASDGHPSIRFRCHLRYTFSQGDDMPTTGRILAVTLAAAFFPSSELALAQPMPSPLKPVTVCEVLMNQQAYDGKNIAVIGRSGRTEEGHWLTETTSERKLETNGFVWPSSIWIECCDQPGPDPPSGSLILDEAALIGKLVALRKSTKLQIRSRQLYKSVDGKDESVGLGDVKDTWAVVYGRVEVKKKLETVLDGRGRINGAGFGHLNAAPVQVVVKQTSIRHIRDEEYPAATAVK